MKYQVLTEELLREVGEIIKENKVLAESSLVEYNEFDGDEDYSDEGGLLDGFEDPETVVDIEEPSEDYSSVLDEIDSLDIEEQVELLLGKGYSEEDIINILAPEEVFGEGNEEEPMTEEVVEEEPMTEEVVEEGSESEEDPMEEACSEPVSEGEEMDEAIGDSISDAEKEAVNYLLSHGMIKKDELLGLSSETIDHIYRVSKDFDFDNMRSQSEMRSGDGEGETIDLDDEETPEGFFPGSIEK